MSIYIRGMEMPSSCMDCPLNYDCMGCSLNGVRWWSDTFVRVEFDPHNERLLECPLVELPEHGRLIDADANIATMEKCAKALDHCTEQLCYNFASSIMKKAPTIIPASGGDENGS